jgi:hypothetical protein
MTAFSVSSLRIMVFGKVILYPPSFFLLAWNLSRMLHMASLSPGFRFHPKCDSLGICHLAFADDVILLSRGDWQFVSSLFQQLTTFKKTSRPDINANKSSIFLWCCRQH